MTEFWISNARHYCKECKCWMDGKASSIRKHEEGFRHKGNVDRLLKQLKRDRIVAQRESHKASMEFAAIERAAKKQYIKDCASGLASSDGHCTFNRDRHSRSSHSHRRKDKRSFLPSDHDYFYYLDKHGTCHGPYPSATMCKWYHFGFFVGGLRIRKREESEFIHLREVTNPFNYSEFDQKFNTDVQFRTRILQSIDISNASMVPPGIDIPQKLKNEFYKMYPQSPSEMKRDAQPKKHEFYSTGNHTDRSYNKQQRKTYIRGHLRKYKSKCNCGDSDCHLKHNHKSDIMKETAAKEEKPKAEVEKKVTPAVEHDAAKSKAEKDDFGFGKWETVTKAAFDAQHSNKELLQREKKRKRWWRDEVNANLPIAKRKKLMGLAMNEDTDSENERDYDDEYGMNAIVQSHVNANEISNINITAGGGHKKAKIAISIGTKTNMKASANEFDEMDAGTRRCAENVIIQDAKLKLKKLHENEEKMKEQKKENMLQKLNDCIVRKNDAMVTAPNLFKKKRKKKNRQKGKIETVMR